MDKFVDTPNPDSYRELVVSQGKNSIASIKLVLALNAKDRYYQKWVIRLFVVNIILGFSSFLSTLNWGLGFVGVPYGLGSVVYPVLILHFILCLFAWDKTFLKGGYIIAVVFTLIIGLLALFSLLFSLE